MPAKRNFIKVNKDERGPIRPQILIMTAADVERDAVLDVLEPPLNEEAVLKSFWDESVYYVGRLGLYDCVLVTCTAGSTGRDGSIAATTHAIERFDPRGVVMVGIAFGKKPETDKKPPKQVMGDVLVSTSIIDYVRERIGPDDPIWRGVKPEADLQFQTRARHCDWTWVSGDDERRVILGPLLSGPKLYDNKQKVRELFVDFGDAIGGEMEGDGIYAAASRMGKPWILIKAVSDWGDGEKAGTDNNQPVAAKNAVAFLIALLSEVEFVPAAAPSKAAALRGAAQEYRLEAARFEIRRRNDERQQSAEQFRQVMRQFADGEGKIRVPPGRRDEVEQEKRRHDTVIETWLNAYEDACMAAFAGDIDVDTFTGIFENEIREFFTKPGPHRERLYPRESSPYDGLWRMYGRLRTA